VLTTSCNGFKIGTATHGAVENVVFTNSVICSEDTPINARVIGGINLEMVDGGRIDGISVSNIRMQNTRTPIFVRLGQRTPSAQTSLRNVRIDSLEASGALVTSSITGVPGLRVSDITISNSRIRTTEGGQAGWSKAPVPEVASQYPEARMFGRLPSYGMYIRHADRIRMHNVEFEADQPDARPAVSCDDVTGLLISGLEATASVGDAPLVALHNTKDAVLSGSRIPAASRVFVQVSGPESTEIAVSGCTTHPSQQPITYTQGAQAPRIAE
jgi:polygalacturonase